MSVKNQNVELIIGVAFILVLGGGLFSILISNSLPGAESDPMVKVKDENSTSFDFETSVSQNGTLNTASKTNKGQNSSPDSKNSNLVLGEEDTINKAQTNTNNSSGETKTYTKPPLNILKENTTYQAEMVTNKGKILIDLYADKTPATVNNFVFLSKEGFYNGTRSHRVIKNFMVQFGDPLTKNPSMKNMWGTGNPGYKFEDEPFEGSYDRGVVAMANSGPNTNGSQFFIMHNSTPLPPNYVIFGKVTDEESLKVLDTIANTTVTRSPSGEASLPTEDIVVESISINEQ